MAEAKPRSVRVDDEVWDEWVREAEKRSWSVSTLLRNAVVALLAEGVPLASKPVVSSAKKGKSAPKEVASNPRPFKPLSKSDQSARSRRKD